MNTFVIASFYKFVTLNEIEALRLSYIELLNHLSLKGTVILATEGINGTVSGLREDMDAFYKALHCDARFSNLSFKETYADFIPFDKAKVKIRNEVVTLGIKDINPNEEVGTYLSPEEWNDMIDDPESLLVDTRNHYEYQLGTFEQAINPNTRNFREFPEYVHEHLLDKKDKKIMMCCTGGIRCEKSTAYLKKLGFENVYHLKGGILNYLDTIPEEQSKWHGTCFVFDDRIAIEKE